MAVTIFDEGLSLTLLQKWNQTGASPVARIRLYTALTPAMSKDTVKANFTEVGAVMGYAAKAVAAGDMSAVLFPLTHLVIGSVTYTWTFTAGAGLIILGWYATDAGNTKAFMGEPFAASVVIPAAGGSLQVNINETYQACT
jgi:hypothetical protein